MMLFFKFIYGQIYTFEKFNLYSCNGLAYQIWGRILIRRTGLSKLNVAWHFGKSQKTFGFDKSEFFSPNEI
jgi:hypothetical protein